MRPISPALAFKQRMARFREACKRAGVKVTHQRLEVFREVVGADDHPDAETIYRGVRARVPTISLDTVYRTLWMLIDLGLVKNLGSSRERVRFDGNSEPHHHFICTRCGQAIDFSAPKFDRLSVPDQVKAVGQVRTTHVEFRGLCRPCAKKMNNKQGHD